MTTTDDRPPSFDVARGRGRGRGRVYPWVHPSITSPRDRTRSRGPERARAIARSSFAIARVALIHDSPHRPPSIALDDSIDRHRDPTRSTSFVEHDRRVVTIERDPHPTRDRAHRSTVTPNDDDVLDVVRARRRPRTTSEVVRRHTSHVVVERARVVDRRRARRRARRRDRRSHAANRRRRASRVETRECVEARYRGRYRAHRRTWISVDCARQKRTNERKGEDDNERRWSRSEEHETPRDKLTGDERRDENKV